MSPSSSGPIGKLNASLIAVSMSSALATPSSSMRMHSRRRIAATRLVMKPGLSLRQTTTVLPRSAANSRARSTVSSDVASPRISSHRRIITGGLKKWMPISRGAASGKGAPMDVIDSCEVLVPSSACGGADSSTSASTERFRSSRSDTASMTTSAVRAAPMSVTRRIRPTAPGVLADVRSFLTKRPRLVWIAASASASASSSMSRRRPCARRRRRSGRCRCP